MKGSVTAAGVSQNTAEMTDAVLSKRPPEEKKFIFIGLSVEIPRFWDFLFPFYLYLEVEKILMKKHTLIYIFF